MDYELPTRHPCICDELHRAPMKQTAKRIQMPVAGTFGMHRPMEGISVYLWDSCPRHGGYLIEADYSRMKLRHPDLWLKYRQEFQMDRYWMYEPKLGHAHGTEPPWEPTYCIPLSGEMVSILYEARNHNSARRLRRDFAPKFSAPEPGEPAQRRPHLSASTRR